MEPFPPPSVLSDAPHDPFVSWSRSDAFLELRVRRSLAIGILISILIHVLLAFLWIRHALESGSDSAPIAPQSLAVRIATPTPPAARPTPPTPEQKSEPSPQPIEKPRPLTRSKPVMTVTRNAPRSAPSTPEPLLPPPIPPSPDQPVDMMSMVTASRERRRQADEAAATDNAAAEAANADPTADQIALANIHRNLEKLKNDSKGESGIFQIRSIGVRTATFSFRGWTTDESNSTLQVIDVDAGPGGNVQLAVVRRMIQLIRTHYTGDFNFDSHREGRVVVQSARIEDTPKLEAFLMREFFGG